jgi:hypothetical protein
MTFTQLVTAVKDATGLSSTEATTRIGASLNRHYKRITSLIQMDAVRFVTRSVSTTNGVQTVTFTEIEKIDRILDTTDSAAIRLLTEVSIHQQRAAQPGTGAATTWALQNTDADSVTVRIDTVPQVTYTLQADGWTTLSDLSGSDEPVFPESFHDILSWFVIAEELLKKEKDKLAGIYESKAKALLGDLQFHLADSHTHSVRQGENAPGSVAGGSSGGSGTLGGTAYTQSALLTFDRGAGLAPFAVAQATAPYVTNLGAEFLGNIASDRLIGRDTAGTGESEQLTVGGGIEFSGATGVQTSAFTGDVTKTAGGTVLTIANNAVTTATLLNGAVTYAKLQDVSAASRVVGRGSAAGSGDAEELTLTAPLSMASTALVVDTQSDQFIISGQVFS